MSERCSITVCNSVLCEKMGKIALCVYVRVYMNETVVFVRVYACETDVLYVFVCIRVRDLCVVCVYVCICV